MADEPAPSELELASRRQTRADKERLEFLTLLLRHPGWAEYEKLLNVHIGERSAQLFEPVGPGLRDAAEHNKGAVYGLIYARDLPRVTVNAMTEHQKSSASDDDGE